MAYSQKEMERQMEEFNAISEEFSRLEALEAQLRKTVGIEEGDKADMKNLPPEVKQAMAEAQEAAQRAGAARAAQSSLTDKPSAGGTPGAGRRGVVRL